jgi:hypothetical protein
MVSSQNPQPHMENELEKKSRELLLQSAERLDGRTRSRLTQARHAALAAIRQRHVLTPLLLPAGIAAAAAMALLLLNPQQPVPVAAVDGLEIVTAEDSLEFYRDVEFYAWLDTVLEADSEV